MHSVRRLIFALFTVILLSLSVNAQEIKYSLGPKCNGTEVVCGANEVPVCLFLEPSVHLVIDGEEKSPKYVPSCGTELTPTCFNSSTGLPVSNNVVLECVEFVQCEDDIAYCSDGKTPECLGNDNEINGCNCKDGSEPVCDYKWQVSNAGSYQ